MIVGSGQKLDAVANNHCINLNIEGKIIKRVDAKSLGLYIDKNLSWSKHIEEISKKNFVWHRRTQKNKAIHFSKYCNTNIQSFYRATFCNIAVPFGMELTTN